MRKHNMYIWILWWFTSTFEKCKIACVKLFGWHIYNLISACCSFTYNFKNKNMLHLILNELFVLQYTFYKTLLPNSLQFYRHFCVTVSKRFILQIFLSNSDLQWESTRTFLHLETWGLQERLLEIYTLQNCLIIGA